MKRKIKMIEVSSNAVYLVATHCVVRGCEFATINGRHYVDAALVPLLIRDSLGRVTVDDFGDIVNIEICIN